VLLDKLVLLTPQPPQGEEAFFNGGDKDLLVRLCGVLV
jgi:hypothetical protein